MSDGTLSPLEDPMSLREYQKHKWIHILANPNGFEDLKYLVCRRTSLGKQILTPGIEQPCLERDAFVGDPGSSNIPGSKLKTMDEIAKRVLAAHLCDVQGYQIERILPSTPLQQGIMALSLQNPGDYMSSKAFQISDQVDLAQFIETLKQMISANAILRTRLVSMDGGIMQIVLTSENSCMVSAWNAEKDIPQFIVKVLGQPLSRFIIHEDKLQRKRYLFWNMHHAICDGWTMDLLLAELKQRHLQQDVVALEDMTLFTKYIIDKDDAAERHFWIEQFEGYQSQTFPITTLRTASPDNTIYSHIGSSDWVLPEFTSATILRAAWGVTIANASNSADVAFGAVVSGRHAPVPRIGFMAGPAIATIPIRVRIDEQASVRHLLNLVQSQAAEMIAYEQTGLQQIALFSKEASSACQFKTLLVIQPPSSTNEDASQDFMREVDSTREHPNRIVADYTYPIVMECQLEEDGAELRISFDSKVITCQQIEYLLSNFRSTAQRLFDQRGMDQPLINAMDKHWNLYHIWDLNTIVPASQDICVHNLISKVVDSNPFAQAICAWDGDLTYRSLDDISTNLAQRLLEYNATNTIVSLFIDKSKWMPVAALAVMKAGGTSLAIDTSLPEERCRKIVHQARSTLVLTSAKKRSFAERIWNGGRILTVDDEETVDGASIAELPDVKPTNLLYINYTSGSTGEPKGVMISHRAFSSAIHFQQKPLGYSSSSRVLDFSSCAFDASWSNMLHALTSGGCLCIPSIPERDNDLAGCIERYKVTTADLTPSIARIVDRTALSSLSTLILGGEPVLFSDTILASSNTRTINVYGPAECTPTATYSYVSPDNVSIGTGAGLCTWVIDVETNKIAQFGDIGELWLEGPLLGEGYLYDTIRTNEKFIANPPWLVAGIPDGPYRAGRLGRSGRVYRTGDLVRYSHDGNLVFVGRRDTQIKLRGQRIELEGVEREVVSALKPISGFSVQAAVELAEDSSGRNAQLIAFITITDNSDSPISTKNHHDLVKEASDGVQDRLEQRIPAFMVPLAYLSLPEMPTGITKKLDRSRLRTMACEFLLQDRLVEKGQNPVMPLNPTEAVMNDVLMSVLNLSKHDMTLDRGFIRLGGDSISAMQVVSKARLRGLNFRVSELLQARSIREIASQCQLVEVESNNGKLLTVDDTDVSTKAFVLSPIQMMFFEAYPDGLNHFNQSFVVEIRRQLSGPTIHEAVQALVSRHPMLRARFKRDPSNHQWIQIIDQDIPTSFAFERHCVSHSEEILHIAQSRQKAFDLENGPVFACDIFDTAEDNLTVILAAHHAVIDLVSWRILLGDLEDFITHGRLIIPPSDSFQKWCNQQALSGQSLSPFDVLPSSIPTPQLDYWGLSPLENTFEDCRTFSMQFNEEVTKALFTDCNEYLGTEPVDILTGVLAYSFIQIFQDREMPAVFIEGHGREAFDETSNLDTSRTVGWFSSLHPRVIPVTKLDTIDHAIRLSKDNRKSTPGKGLPYFLSRHYNSNGRKIFQDHSIPEITLNFIGRFQQLEREGGLIARPSSLNPASLALVEVDPSAQRLTYIEVIGDIEMDQMTISIQVHNKMKHEQKRRQWIEEFSYHLRYVAKEFIRRPRTLTLTDVDMCGLTYDELDRLLNTISGKLNIPLQSITDIYPCSAMQEGILTSLRKAPELYATNTIWRCITAHKSSISILQLERSWKTLVKRHTVLQSIFVLHPGRNTFLQLVIPGSHIITRHIFCGEEDVVSALKGLEQPTFDPLQPPHIFTICQADNGETACRLDIQHTLIDAISLNGITRELKDLYSGEQLATAAPFSNFIRHVQKIPMPQAMAFWMRTLAGLIPCVVQSIQLVLSSGANPKCTYASIVEPPGVTELCKTLAVTRTVFLQVAWSLVLSRFTGQRDVCFGYLAWGRDTPLANIDSIVGPVANILVSRINLDKSIAEVLKHTQEICIRRLEMQHIPLREIQHKLGFSGSQLFNTAISIQNSTKEDEAAGSLELSIESGEDPQEYDLFLSARFQKDTMCLVLEAKEELFSHSAINQISSCLSKAMHYLVSTSSGQARIETSLFDDFFESCVGQGERSTRAYWTKEFAQFQRQSSPKLQMMRHSDVSNRQISSRAIPIKQNTLYQYGLVSITRIAWALLEKSLLQSDETHFGMLTTDCSDLYPVRMNLDFKQRIVDALVGAQQCSSQMQRFEHSSLSYIRSISEQLRGACNFPTVLMIDDRSSLTECPTGEFQDPDGNLEMYALSIHVRLYKSSIVISVTSYGEVLGGISATRLSYQFETVFTQLLDANMHHRCLNAIGIASPQDLKDIWSWNKSVPDSVEACIDDMIQEQAAKTPDAMAIEAWNGTLTYRDLISCSIALADVLLAAGIGQGSVVLLLFEKSVWMPVAALAVMFIGGASLAADITTQPEERLKLIACKTKVEAILCSSDNKNLAVRLGPRVVVVNSELFNSPTNGHHKDRVPVEFKQATWPRSRPFDNLYFITTSGSSGTPKILAVTHASFCAAIKHQRHLLGYTQTSRILDFSSYAFDVWWSNLLNTLTIGATLCIPSADECKNDLSNTITKYRTSLLDLTPSLARHLRGLSGLTTLILGGETVRETDKALGGSGTQVINAYGPAECTPTATICKLGSNAKGELGKGAGACTWLVDPDNYNKLAPIGGIGELALEGPIVNNGYVYDQNNAVKSFITDPRWLTEGIPGTMSARTGVLYLTGDLMKYKLDGSLSFIGRKDNQVKHRGQRIELEEIEYHIGRALEHYEVSIKTLEVIVEVCQREGSEASSLIAFLRLVAKDRSTDDVLKQVTSKIKEELLGSLPIYMLPDVYTSIENVPRFPAGKLDRRAIRALGSALLSKQSTEASKETNIRPVTKAEHLLHSVWADILQRDPLDFGTTQNFFALGGDSIGAIRCVQVLREQDLTCLTVQNFFERPCIRDLASLVGDLGDHEPSTSKDALSKCREFNNTSLEQEMIQVIQEHDRRAQTSHELAAAFEHDEAKSTPICVEHDQELYCLDAPSSLRGTKRKSSLEKVDSSCIQSQLKRQRMAAQSV